MEGHVWRYVRHNLKIWVDSLVKRSRHFSERRKGNEEGSVKIKYFQYYVNAYFMTVRREYCKSKAGFLA